MNFLDPSDDLVFKVLFKDPEAERRLIAMLTAILEPSSPIVSARVLNPNLPPDLVSGKAVVLDILVKLGDGRRICIELEARPRRVFIQRDLFYWSRAYSGQLGGGENYVALRPTIAIAWLGDPQDGSRSVVDSPRVHTRYRICETTTHVELTDHLEIHLLDLRKLLDDATLSPALRRWAEFLSHPTADTLRRLAQEDEIMAETIKKLEEVSADEELRYLVEARQMGEFQRRIYEGAAHEEGLEQGRSAMARALVSVLESRLGAIPPELRVRIESLGVEGLEHALPNAATASSLDAFIALSLGTVAPRVP